MADDRCRARTPSRADILLLEYAQLKEEQRMRITTRDQLIYATLAAVATVGGAALQLGAMPLLLLLPPVCLILGWTYLSNDEKVSMIGVYIQRELLPRLSHEPDGLLGWERAHRTPAYRRRSHPLAHLVTTLLTYCGPGVIAVVANLDLARDRFGALVVTAAVTTIGLLAAVITAVGLDQPSRQSDI